MDQVTASSGAWTSVISGSSVATILQVKTPARLCFGDDTGIALSVGIDVPAGYQVIVPAGLDVSMTPNGALSAVAVTGPFGV